ncbi:MAG: aldehyde dehydrogenase [Acidobacteria bacterium RIFCSPLOWO2_02_FULL_68_18]|nr:MAG: aldehyde dehydrogenase [Acidobacteria bacterium RIFCSPLOWO2_02_FULL_68_18]OFW51060.1 MAG: aldehyde dehydrogenase [Acidobacteria bacterium RIFCSPLOWO2_12_FULL_68_19]
MTASPATRPAHNDLGAIPSVIPNHIGGHDALAVGGRTFEKIDPATGRAICRVARSTIEDVRAAVEAARAAQPSWAATTAVRRGEILRQIALLMREHRTAIAALVARETGKSHKDALGETDAAIEMGFFVAGEGRRFYGQTTTSAAPNKAAMVLRQPLGVAGLIIAANTPIANVAWKAFPALLCGNAAILKAAEDTPLSAWAFGVLARTAGVPDGVYTTLHGFGEEAGAPLVEHPDVAVVSFTGSCDVGRWIAETAGRRLAKTCLELGGKNPLIVCDDADLQPAVTWALGSAFSNAGQRCAAGSRIVVFDAVYERFKQMFVDATTQLKIGTADTDDYGPVINEAQMASMLASVERARAAGASVLTGGHRLTGERYGGGFFVAPTIIEHVGPNDEISRSELFGPITCLYRVKDFEEAIALANDSPFGLTASIHTRNLNRAMAFIGRIQSGVAIVNGGTYGSEPHMPFGGLRQSGNGWREAGTQALDVYSDLKTVYINHNPAQV